MTDTLTALDATFLELEQQDEGALMSIGGVMVFDPLPDGGVPTVEEVCANLGPRLGQLPRYSQRLSSQRTGGFAWPHWTDDERFDIRAHVGHAALPAPGGGAELCDWAADFYSHRLDRTRPLWEMVLIEGLEHGRWALAHKTHHCLVDGVGSVDVAYLLLDAEPTQGEYPSTPTPPPRGEYRLRAFVPHPPQPLAQAVRAGAHAASAWLRDLPTSEGAHAATFDTRLDKSPWLTGVASRGIAKRLRGRGYDVVGTESFLVEDSEGPLEEGELDRARARGRELALLLAARAVS